MATTAPPPANCEIGMAVPVIQGVRTALDGACVVQWRVSSTSTEHPRFWAVGRWAMGRLSMKPELATRHDPQTTHRPEKCASNPAPVASNATRRHTTHSPSQLLGHFSAEASYATAPGLSRRSHRTS
jgi:hypothetical protein